MWQISAAAVSAAAMGGLSAALWWGNQEQRLRATRPERSTGHARVLGPVSWLAARPDAMPFRRRVVLALVAGLAGALALHRLGGVFALLGWVALPLVTLGGVVVLGRLEPDGARRRTLRLVLDLPQALELMSACLAAGMPLRRATVAVGDSYQGPVAEDLQQVSALVGLGVSDAEAWRTLRSSPLWGPAAVDLARSVESGTMMVDVLVHHAEAARNHRRSQLEVRAKSVGVRSVLPLMTCFLPSFLLLGVVPTVASALANALF